MSEALLRIRQQSRLAITVRDPNTDIYPAAEDEPNTYWIVFVDGTFLEAQGNQAHALTARQNLDAARALAHNLVDGPNAYVEENTLIEVTWHSRHWWFYCGAETPSTSSGSSGSSAEESSGSSSSGDEESSGSSSGESGEKCWVGLDGNGINIHFKPLSFTEEADPALPGYMVPAAPCGICFDDAGHFIGFYDSGGSWSSPWNILDPGLL